MKESKPYGREPPNEVNEEKKLTEINCFNFDKTGHFSIEIVDTFRVKFTPILPKVVEL